MKIKPENFQTNKDEKKSQNIGGCFIFFMEMMKRMIVNFSKTISETFFAKYNMPEKVKEEYMKYIYDEFYNYCVIIGGFVGGICNLTYDTLMTFFYSSEFNTKDESKINPIFMYIISGSIFFYALPVFFIVLCNKKRPRIILFISVTIILIDTISSYLYIYFHIDLIFRRCVYGLIYSIYMLDNVNVIFGMVICYTVFLLLLVFYVINQNYVASFVIEIIISGVCLSVFILNSVFMSQQNKKKSFINWFLNQEKSKEIKEQNDRNKSLLKILLPEKIIKKLQKKSDSLKKKQVFYHFTCEDIAVGFIKINSERFVLKDITSKEIIYILHNCFLKIDSIILRPEFKNLFKIKTSQEKYLFVSGDIFPDDEEKEEKKSTDQIKNISRAIVFSFEVLKEFIDSFPDEKISVSVGIHQGGELITAIFGSVFSSTNQIPNLDIFGDVVNMAARAMTSCVRKNSILLEDSLYEKSEIADIKPLMIVKKGINLTIKGKEKKQMKFTSIYRINSNNEVLNFNSEIYPTFNENNNNISTIIDLLSTVDLDKNEETEIFKKKISNEKLNKTSQSKHFSFQETSLPYEDILDEFMNDEKFQKNATTFTNVLKYYIFPIGVFRKKRINSIYYKNAYKTAINFNRFQYLILYIFYAITSILYFIRGIDFLNVLIFHFGCGSFILFLFCCLVYTPLYNQ